MTRLSRNFNSNSDNVDWYDVREDWTLIEASLAKQYGVRIRHEADMPWNEFCTLVSGLMPDTPLGQIVGIRAEKNPDTIKGFSPDQRRIHNSWLKRQAEKMVDNPDKLNKDMEALSQMIASMFG